MESKIILPELGENIEAADVSAVLVAVGDEIQRDQPVIEVETEKASLEVPASADGRVTELKVSAGDTVKVGQVILVLEAAAAAGPAETKTPRPKPEPKKEPGKPVAEPPRPVVAAALPTPPERSTLAPLVPAAPSVRALARELGVDIRQVTGSAAAGRITRQDVKAHAKQLIVAARAGTAPGRPLPDFSRWGEVVREPLTRIRRATAENLAHAWNVVPHVTQFDRSDISDLERDRKQANQQLEAGAAKLTVTAIILKNVAEALVRFPKFNASLDLDAGELVLKQYVHLGVAVDTADGLFVPTLRNIGERRIDSLREGLARIKQDVLARSIPPQELRGQTITLSNFGSIGGRYAELVVVPPQVAIVGTGRIQPAVLAIDDKPTIRRQLPLSLSFDHRAVTGAEAARFMAAMIDDLELSRNDREPHSE